MSTTLKTQNIKIWDTLSLDCIKLNITSNLIRKSEKC